MRRSLRAAVGVGVVMVAALLAPSGITRPRPIVYTTSTVIAGYEVVATRLTTISGQFTIPTLVCGASTSGIGPGVFVTGSFGNPKHPTSGFSGAGTLATCTGGAPTFTIGTIVNSVEKHSVTVKSGDRLSVAVLETPHRTTVTVRDLTSGAGASDTGAGGKLISALAGSAGISVNHVAVGVDRFTPVQFSRVLIQGRSLLSWNPFAIERVRGAGKHQVVQIRPAAINHTRMGFILSFVHS
jgi:hypothetical protein